MSTIRTTLSEKIRVLQNELEHAHGVNKVLQTGYENAIAVAAERREVLEAHTRLVGDFLSQMHAIMIDPLADGEIKVEEVCAKLIATATTDREELRKLHDVKGFILSRLDTDLHPAVRSTLYELCGILGTTLEQVRGNDNEQRSERR